MARLTALLLSIAVAALAQTSPTHMPEVVLDRATSDIFPESWRTPKIDAAAEPLDEAARALCREAVEKALAKYPSAVLDANLKKVYVLGGLRYSGVSTAGTRSKSAVYVVRKSSYSAAQVEGIFHAEFSSILLKNFPSYLDQSSWQQLNPPGFMYRNSGVQAIKDKKASLKYNDALLEEGFLNEYSKASIEEDFNSYAGRLFEGHGQMWGAMKKFPKVKAKADLTIAFYSKLDARFTHEFFQILCP